MTDKECVQAAYEQELTAHVANYIGACQTRKLETTSPEDAFASGLVVIRAARITALEMVK